MHDRTDFRHAIHWLPPLVYWVKPNAGVDFHAKRLRASTFHVAVPEVHASSRPRYMRRDPFFNGSKPETTGENDVLSQDAGRWLSQAPVQREQAVFVAHSGFQAAYVLESADDKEGCLFAIVRVTCPRRAIPRCVRNRLQPGGPVYNNQQSVSTIPVAVYNYRQLGPPGILLLLSPIIYRTVSIHPTFNRHFRQHRKILLAL